MKTVRLLLPIIIFSFCPFFQMGLSWASGINVLTLDESRVGVQTNPHARVGHNEG